MSEWIKKHQYTANALTTLLLIILFFFTVIKPYVDKQDTQITTGIMKKLQESITIQKTISDDLKEMLKK